MKEVRIKSPATVANFVCGFDVLGFAVEEPFDEMTISLREDAEIKIVNLSEFDFPLEAEKNVAGVALLALREKLKEKVGFTVEINKKIKPGSGIGSSSASSAGAVVGANILLGNIFDKQTLVDFASSGEKVASGVKHADNVAPCILGGVSLVRSNNPLDVVGINSPHFFVSLVHPQIEIKTADARGILQEKVLLKDAVKQLGSVAGLVAGLMKEDYDLISRSLTDYLIEPVRSVLIPAFNEIKNKSVQAGAIGGGISGSGPSVFMLSKTRKTAENVCFIMQDIYQRIGLECQVYLTTINKTGACQIDFD